MRGDGDEPMAEDDDLKANTALLERIVADQRKLIAKSVNPDVTLLWCDDNWGNIHRLPTPAERKCSGGAGIYCHFDYVGSPRSYKWLNTNPLPKVWEQMNMANEHGANRIWIVNVGDLKPMEVPIEFFLRMAWNPARWPTDSTDDFMRQWPAHECGAAYAEETASLVETYLKFNSLRKSHGANESVPLADRPALAIPENDPSPAIQRSDACGPPLSLQRSGKNPI